MGLCIFLLQINLLNWLKKKEKKKSYICSTVTYKPDIHIQSADW